MRWLISELGKMRTAVGLLAFSALVSLLGTVVVQGLPLQDYVAEYGVFWGQVVWQLGLHDVFRAWWFLAVQAVLLVSVSVCLWRNAPIYLRRLLKKFEVVRLGYLLVHFGVLGVAIAGLVSGLIGWRGVMNLREGEVDNIALVWHGREATPKVLPFKVANEEFVIEHYPTGMPKRYATRLVVDGVAHEVEVNKPLRVGEYVFYQASFGDGGSEVWGQGIEVQRGVMTPFAARIYEETKLTDGTRIELLDFRPFTVETMRGVRPADVGPSVDYVVQPPDAPARQLRAYVNYPDWVGVADGVRVGGMADGTVVYRPVYLGDRGGGSSADFWRVVSAVVGGADFKAASGGYLWGIKDEQARLAAGVGLMQAARVVAELELTHLLVLEDFTLRRYSGLQVVYDPAVQFFWLFAGMLLVGVVCMLVGRGRERGG
ncbi:MAG: hypothetical protein EBQ80_03125 [Proteobacteria bacterium]|nr:hypothetical protein [Pseudomonadota bacterium]